MAPVELPPDIQQHLDDAVRAMGDAAMLHPQPELEPVTHWLERKDHLVDVICDGSSWLHVVAPGWLADRCARLDDHPGTPAKRLEVLRNLLERALGGDTDLWGEEYPVRVPVEVSTSWGATLVLGCVFLTFAMDPPVRWEGLFRDEATYRRWLRELGHVTSLEDFDALPKAQRLAMWDLDTAPDIATPNRETECPGPGGPQASRPRSTPRTRVSRVALPPRYYAVEAIPLVGEAGWEFESDSLEHAFSAFSEQVAANIARYGSPQSVLLFDRHQRRLVTSTRSGNPEAEVRYWLREE